MGFTVTTLVENTVTASIAPLIAEHGLSFLIETGDRTILFDAGQGVALPHNVELMGIDLKKVDTVVISHGHYDHAKGLKKLAEINSNFELVAHSAVFEDKRVGFGNETYPIGMGVDRQFFENSGIRLRLENGAVKIAPGMTTTGEIPMTTDFESVEAMFFTGQADGSVKADTLPDDNALILDTENGLVVIFGCAHRGAVNTLNHVTALTGKKKIHAIMGGLHLFLADAPKLDKLCDTLAGFDIDKMIVGHCTGFPATAALHQRFGSKVIPNAVGLKMTF